MTVTQQVNLKIVGRRKIAVANVTVVLLSCAKKGTQMRLTS